MNRRCQILAGWLARAYRYVLAVYPAEFRHEYAAEMTQFFNDDCRLAARRGGLPGLLLQGARTLADVILTAPGVHMSILAQDLRFGFRMLRHNPGFSLTAILALTLGIGANSAIFSMVHGILLAPLPFAEPDRLMMLWEKNPRGIERNSVSPPNFNDYRAGAKSFSHLAAFSTAGANLTLAGASQHLTAATISPEFFDVLDVRPVFGAGLRPNPGPTDPPEAVLSHSLWERSFSADPGVIGRTVRMDERPYVIAGVMPPDFRFPSGDVAIWAAMPRSYLQLSRQAHFLSVIGRLQPAVSVAEARGELDTLARGLASAYPASNRNWGVTLVPLKEQIVGEIRRPLAILLGAVSFILLIACANIANLLLARTSSRRGEIALRTALGASSIRIGRQLLTESVLLALLGGAAGLLLCWGASASLKVLKPAGIPRVEELGVSAWVIAFTFGVALLTGIVSGIAPALQGFRADLREGLKETAGNRRSFAGRGLRGVLISAEIALSILLLVGAGLLIRSFMVLQRLDPGFDPSRAVTLTIDLPQSRFPNAPQRAAFLQQATARIRELPGVEAAGMISTLPLTGGEGFNRFGFTMERTEDPATIENHRFYARWITPGYFAGMGIPLLKGRDFTAQDRAGSAPAVIIDAALARRYFAGGNPIGRFLRLSYDKTAPREIVGVAGDVRLISLESEPAPQIYIPVLQEAQLSSINLVVRTAATGPATPETVRRELLRIEPDVPVYGVRTVASRLEESMAPRRFPMLLLTLMAALALVLAAVGVYGVTSYMVGQRQHEIGVRMAFGARPREILLLVAGQGMKHAIIGIAGGLLASFLLTRAMSGLLFGVNPVDAWTFGTVALLAAVVACMACLAPALRASTLDAVHALRSR